MSLTTIPVVLRFLWVASAGYRLRPWRSPYLRWRLETYMGWKAGEIGFSHFCSFAWRERRRLLPFLKWVAEMERLRAAPPVARRD
jgi:hypothetical protein